MLLGIVFDGEKNPREAEQEFEKAVELEPGMPSAHINLGKHDAQQGDLSAAEREFESAVRLDPEIRRPTRISAWYWRHAGSRRKLSRSSRRQQSWRRANRLF